MAGKKFDLDLFLSQPSWDQVSDIRKVDWIAIANHFQISLPTHPSKVKKAVVKNLVLKYLIDHKLLEVIGENAPVSDETSEGSDQNENPDLGEAVTTFQLNNLQSDPPFSLELEKYKLELQHRREIEIRRLEVEREANQKRLEVEREAGQK